MCVCVFFWGGRYCTCMCFNTLSIHVGAAWRLKKLFGNSLIYLCQSIKKCQVHGLPTTPGKEIILIVLCLALATVGREMS